MEEFSAFLGVFGAVYGIVAIFSSVIGLVMYLLKAFGIYNMSKSLGINNAWFSFIPLVNTYTFGKVAESYKLKSGKKSAKFGFWLLVLNILQVIAVIALIVTLILLVAGIASVEDGMIEDSAALRAEIISAIIPFVVAYFLTLAIAITLTVVRYVALWRIYDVFSKNNATLFIILSILFSFLEPIFLFIIRNNPPMFNTVFTVPVIDEE